MNIEKLFPFVSYAKVIKRVKVEDFDLHQSNYFRTKNISISDERMKTILKNTNISDGAYVSIARIMPNDVYVYLGSNEEIDLAMNATNRPDTVNALVIELDYGRLVQELEYENIGDSIVVTKLATTGGFETVRINDDTFIQDAKLGLTSNLAGRITESLSLNEDDIEDLVKSLASTGVVRNVQSKEPPFYQMIRNYLGGSNAGEKIPLLVGMSGIAKSAMVSSLANEFGMRLVDLRVSFMSRLDVDGLTQIIGAETGTPFSQSAPMMEFLTCTDEYIEFSRKMVTVIEDKLKTASDSEVIRDLEEALVKFKESSKIPVLFLDEITRSDKSIRGALTTIINQRIYNQYNLKMARLIAATNAPVGYEDDPDMEDFFIGASLEDVAVLDRFNKVAITPEEVMPIWKKYIENEGDFSKEIIDYLNDNPRYAYDISPAVDKAHDYDREDNLIPPYPTFRAWKNVSDFLKSLKSQSSTEINKDILFGLLGDKHGEEFLDYLKGRGYSEKYLLDVSQLEGEGDTTEVITTIDTSRFNKGLIPDGIHELPDDVRGDIDNVLFNADHDEFDVLEGYLYYDILYQWIKDGKISDINDLDSIEKLVRADLKNEGFESEEIEQMTPTLVKSLKIIIDHSSKGITKVKAVSKQTADSNNPYKPQGGNTGDKVIVLKRSIVSVSVNLSHAVASKFVGDYNKGLREVTKIPFRAYEKYISLEGKGTKDEVIKEVLAKYLRELSPANPRVVEEYIDTVYEGVAQELEIKSKDSVEFDLPNIPEALPKDIYDAIEDMKLDDDVNAYIYRTLISTMISDNEWREALKNNRHLRGSELKKALKETMPSSRFYNYPSEVEAILDKILDYANRYADDSSSTSPTDKPRDYVTDFVSDTLDAGLPAMIMGASGLGKTTRIKEYCQKRGYDFEIVSLATKDRMDIMGPPSMVDITNFIGKESSGVFDKLGLKDEINNLKSKCGLPQSVTVRSPKSELGRKIRKAVETGVPLVILFDEFNRCVLGSTKVKLLDGTSMTMKELHDTYGTDKEFYVYGCTKEGNFIPGKAHSWGITRKSAELVEVKLDNGKSIICTPDHAFMLRNGKYVNAEDLTQGTSLMAMYFGSKGGRETVSVAGSPKQFTHRLVGNYLHNNYVSEGLHCHHTDRNVLNNDPRNLEVLTPTAHSYEHRMEKTEWTRTEEGKEILAQVMVENFKNNIDKREVSRLATIRDEVKGGTFRKAIKEGHNTSEYLEAQSSRAKSQWESGQFDNIDRQSALIKNRRTQLINFIEKLFLEGYEVTEENYEELRKANTGRGKLAYRSAHVSNAKETTGITVGEAIEIVKNAQPKNHKVVSVTKLDYTEDVYDIYVEDCHNFLVDLEDNSGVVIHNCIDPTVQTAIFQCLDDPGSFGGITFPKGLVKVALAGNLGDSTMEAGDVDGALTARAVQYKKLTFDEDDAKAVLQYMKDNNFAKPLLNYLGDDYAKVLSLIKSVDQGSLTSNVSSTRSLHALSDAILESINSPMMHGTVLVADQDLVTEFNMRGKRDTDLLKRVVKLILDKSPNWAAIGSFDYVDGQDLKTVMGQFEKIANAYLSGRDELGDYVYTIVANLLTLDSEVANSRRKLFGYYVDEDFANEFTEYYNTVSGTAQSGIEYEGVEVIDLVLSIDDVNPRNLTTYLDQELPNFREWHKLIRSIWDRHSKDLGTSDYVDAIRKCENMYPSEEEMLRLSEVSEECVLYIEEDTTALEELTSIYDFSRDEVLDAKALKENPLTSNTNFKYGTQLLRNRK